jgi:hypothetical protein
MSPVAMAKLSKAPESLEVLWKEFTDGINGNKPARDFTPAERGANKSLYCRRKVFWDCIDIHCKMGFDWRVAVNKVYEAYGNNLPVTQILLAMTADKARNGHPNLRIR